MKELISPIDLLINNHVSHVFDAIEATQDGCNLKNDSDWNVFIKSRIEYNSSGDWVDTENLLSDMDYMINQLGKIKVLLEMHHDKPF